MGSKPCICLTELKRRRVNRVAVVYTVAGLE
jgi:hypothetical protein